jgi:hypothetical protein
MEKVNLSHDWAFCRSHMIGSDSYMVCKECGGKLGTETIEGKITHLPYPGDKCPTRVIRFVHES